MVFHADAAYALILIALGIGFWVLIKAKSPEAGNLKGFGTILGYVIIVLSFLVLLCASYYSIRYWEDGYFTKPASMGAMMGPMSMQGGSGMHGMMQGAMQHDCQNMKGDRAYCPHCGKELKAGEKPSGMHGKMEGMMDQDNKMEHADDDE